MNLAIIGVHRTGKTTLAKEFESKGFQYTTFSVSDYFQQEGIDPSVPMDFVDRLRVQYDLLLHFQTQLDNDAKTHQARVYDRSPLDLAAYLLADISMATANADDALAMYLENAINLHTRHFTHVALIQPALTYVPEPNKGGTSGAYRTLLNYVYLGLLNKDVYSKKVVLPKLITDLDKRLSYIYNHLFQS